MNEQQKQRIVELGIKLPAMLDRGPFSQSPITLPRFDLIDILIATVEATDKARAEAVLIAQEARS